MVFMKVLIIINMSMNYICFQQPKCPLYPNLYDIRDKKEAEEYLKHKIFGERMREITNALLRIELVLC